MSGSLASSPLPDDPVLAEWALALNDAGYWAYVLDASWRVVFVTDERRSAGGSLLPVGCSFFGPESIAFFTQGRGRAPDQGAGLDTFRRIWGPLALATMPGGRESLRRQVDSSLLDLVDEMEPASSSHAFTVTGTMLFGGSPAGIVTTWFRIDDEDGVPVGAALLLKPSVGMSELAVASASADHRHLARMRTVQRAKRRPAAILIADIEGSSPLARRLSTAEYFSFGRRLVRAADQCVIDQGGIVGRHIGDGVVAFFLAETSGSESAAARSCIVAARALRRGLAEMVAGSEVLDDDVCLHFGLHWGATLYIGRFLTAGRSEVTALGDEVNEAARIEACATGGKALASKSLIERLNAADADMVGIDTSRTSYTALAELATATEKARRDAPLIAVCEI